MENGEKKIDTVETFLVMSISIVSDIAELFTLGTIGVLINFVVGALLAFWVYMRNLKYTRFVVSAGLDLIPFVNALPLKSIGVWFTIKLANNPKVSAVTQKASVPKGIPHSVA